MALTFGPLGKGLEGPWGDCKRRQKDGDKIICWRKGNSYYVTVESLVTLSTAVISKVEDMLQVLVNMAEKISRQNIASTSWFLLAADNEI